jgi:hypothetical protein
LVFFAILLNHAHGPFAGINHVKVPGEHERLVAKIATLILCPPAWDYCPKAKFFLEDTRSGNKIYLLDADRKFEVETRTRGSHGATKALHYGGLLRLYRVPA